MGACKLSVNVKSTPLHQSCSCLMLKGAEGVNYYGAKDQCRSRHSD